MQGHFPHSPQLPAGLHPRWTPEADRRVRLPPERASSSAALHQTPPGQPDVPVTLLRLPERTQEQVRVRYRQKVSQHFSIKEKYPNLGKYVYWLACMGMYVCCCALDRGGTPCAPTPTLRMTSTSTGTTAPTPPPSPAPQPRMNLTPVRTSCPPSPYGSSSGSSLSSHCWGTQRYFWSC